MQAFLVLDADVKSSSRLILSLATNGEDRRTQN